MGAKRIELNGANVDADGGGDYAQAWVDRVKLPSDALAIASILLDAPGDLNLANGLSMMLDMEDLTALHVQENKVTPGKGLHN